MDNIDLIKVIRPNLDNAYVDNNGMPIIKKTIISYNDNQKVTNFKNIKYVKDKKNTIIDMFNYDKVLDSLWNNPFKYIPMFLEYQCIATPDFSVYENMNKFEIEHNVFKNRWLGCLWQSLGVNVIPTVSWCNKETYDICFSGIEKCGAIIISTLGVNKNLNVFEEGYKEMVKRLNPSLIIVIGKMYDFMQENILLYELKDTFNPKCIDKQMSFFDLSHNFGFE